MTHKMSPLKQKMVTNVIRKEGLILSDFEFNPITNDSFNLVYKPHSQYNFKHNRSINGQSIYHLCPGPNGDLNFVVQPKKFDDTLEELKKWLGYLKENIEIGNPWEEISEYQNQLFDNYFDSYEELLNSQEVIRFERALDLLFEKISSLDNKIDTLNYKFDPLNDKVTTIQIHSEDMQKDMSYLKQQAGKLSKKDLWLLFLGTLFNWSLTEVVSKDSFITVLQFISQILSEIQFPKLL
jgi:hypothetical protein